MRFRKEGDLRLISHRDLARLLERLFRRADLPLSMSEGFHPKPRISFPAPLAVGVLGVDEVLEVELAQKLSAAEVLERLALHAPPGLAFVSAEEQAAGTRKVQVRRVTYEMPLPSERRDHARTAIESLLAASDHVVQRPDRGAQVDLRAKIDGLVLVEDRMRFHVLVTREGSARPREVLAALGLADLEQEGLYLTRTAVEVEP